MNIELDQCIANNSLTAEAEDLARDPSTKGERKARAKQVAAAPAAPAGDMTAAQKAHEVEALAARLENDDNARCGYDIGATLTLVPPEGVASVAPANSVQLEGEPLDEWARAHPLPLAGAPLRDWARAFHGAGLYPVRGHGVVTPATPCECADKKTCEHRARCACGKAACAAPGKHPTGQGWQNKDRAFDPDAFVEGDNIGLLMGLQRGGEYLIALDVDDLARMANLVGVLGDPGPTMVGRSARGERRIYRLGDDVPRGKDRLKNITGLTLEVERQTPPPGVRSEDVKVGGVDCKVDGGYLVVGPSLHPTGVRYEWTAWREPAVLPAAWTQALLAPEPRPKALEKYSPLDFETNRSAQKRHLGWVTGAVIDECRLIARAAPGTAHHTVLTALSRLYPMARGVGGTDEERRYIAAEVRRAGQARKVPERELEALIRDQWNWAVENDHRREMPDRPLLGRVRHQPAGEGDHEAIAREEQELEDWDGAEATEPGRHVRVSTIDFIQSKGSPANCAENVARLLAHEPAWNRGPRYDRFSRTVRWPSPLPEPIAKIQRSGLEVRKSDMAKIQASAIAFDLQVGLETVDAGVSLHADQNSYDSLSDWLRSLTWDGTARLDTWVPRYLGCADTPMHRAAGSSFLRAWVQRQLIPGEVVDLVPILQGPQNAGKNRAIATLFANPPDVPNLVATMQLFDPNHKDMPRFACSRAVIFIDEFRGDTRTMDAVKTWISATNDQWVEKYEKHAGTYDRRAMLIGATNQTAYLVDPSGARRFYPWKIGAIDIDALARDRDQLLAEAVARGGDWREGLDDGAVKAELDATREDAHEVDPLAERLAHLAATGGWTGPLKIADFTRLLNLTAKDELGDPRYATRFGTAAKRIGAVCERITAAKIRVYHPPGCSCADGRARNLHP
jgi:hypothetical protein